ncbi:hypothetical protein CBL_13313 [Carabus blaptoides fortunei]
MLASPCTRHAHGRFGPYQTDSNAASGGRGPVRALLEPSNLLIARENILLHFHSSNGTHHHGILGPPSSSNSNLQLQTYIYVVGTDDWVLLVWPVAVLILGSLYVHSPSIDFPFRHHTQSYTPTTPTAAAASAALVEFSVSKDRAQVGKEWKSAHERGSVRTVVRPHSMTTHMSQPRDPYSPLPKGLGFSSPYVIWEPLTSPCRECSLHAPQSQPHVPESSRAGEDFAVCGKRRDQTDPLVASTLRRKLPVFNQIKRRQRPTLRRGGALILK